MSRGFTLMELLVVVAIISILAMVGLGNFAYSLQKGRDAQRKSDLGQVARALEAYANDNNGIYPGDNSLIPWGAQWKVNNNLYMAIVPNDPSAGNKYFYELQSDGSGYALYSTLENSHDQYYKASGWSDVDCGANVCRYKLSNGGAEK